MIRPFKRLNLSGCLAAAAMLVTFNVNATLTFTGSELVGTVKPGKKASIDAEVQYVNHLLSLGAGVVNSFNGFDYATSSTDHNGIVSVLGASKLEADLDKDTPNPDFSTSGHGFDFVLAKYGGGDKGGYVVWSLGGAPFTLPTDSTGLWENPSHKGYGISHWTGFSAVPEPTTMIAGALLLLPFGLSALRVLRRTHQA